MVDRGNHPGPSAGFTLLEVLVSLVLLGFILVALAGGVQFGTRAWDAQEHREAKGAELDAVHALLRRLIADARPLPLTGLEPLGAPLYMDGRSSGMSFVSDLPESIGRGGPYDVTLALVEGGRLVLRWRPHMRITPGSSAPRYEETELVRGVAALDIRYFVPAPAGQQSGWSTEWRQPAALPALIQVRLRLIQGGTRHWTDLVVAPLLGSTWG